MKPRRPTGVAWSRLVRPLDGRAAAQPGGLPAGSRGLSAAIPPGAGQEMEPHPEGVPESDATEGQACRPTLWHPFGVRLIFQHGIRGCRCARPPATGCHPSGMNPRSVATIWPGNSRCSVRRIHGGGGVAERKAERCRRSEAESAFVSSVCSERVSSEQTHRPSPIQCPPPALCVLCASARSFFLAQRSLRPQRWPTVRFHAPNDPAHRPRASDDRNLTETQSRGSCAAGS
jgi:hypothetical protein